MPVITTTSSFFVYFLLIYINLHGVATRKPKMTPAVEELLIQEGDELKIICQGEDRLQFSTQILTAIEAKHSNFTVLSDEASNTYTFIRPITISSDTGWYACAEEGIEIKNDEQTIDHTSKDIAWIYVYVNSSAPFAVMDAVFETIYVSIGASAVIIPCRPTSPHLPVVMRSYFEGQPENILYDPKIGFIIRNVDDTFTGKAFECNLNATTDYIDWPIYVLWVEDNYMDSPVINQETLHHVVWGQNLTLLCSIRMTTSTPLELEWEFPDSVSQDRLEYLSFHKLNDTFGNVHGVFGLKIKNVEETDGGEYICITQDSAGHITQSSVDIKIWDPSYMYLNVSIDGEEHILASKTETAAWKITIDAYPHNVTCEWYKPDGTEINVEVNERYSHEQNGINNVFRISQLDIEDSGNYTIRVSSPINETSQIILPLTVTGKTSSVQISNTLPYYPPDQTANFSCSTVSSFLPDVKWSYKEYPDFPNIDIFDYRSLSNIRREEWGQNPYHVLSVLEMALNVTGDLICESCGKIGCTKSVRRIIISDVAGYFDINDPGIVTVGDNVSVTCGASVYNFTDKIKWRPNYSQKPNFNMKRIQISERRTEFTWQSILRINNVTLSDSEVYFCVAINNTGYRESKPYQLLVNDAQAPQIINTTMHGLAILIDPKRDGNKVVPLTCFAEGRPVPKVLWRKNNKLLKESIKYKFSENNFKLEIVHFSEADIGRYSCHATNRVSTDQRYTDIKIAEEPVSAIWSSLTVAVILLVIMVACMAIQKRRDRESRKRFMEATLERFNGGALDCLDPVLNMGDQAELLPYNRKWEYPRELLKFGKVLGSGAFGIVKKAEAKSICRNEAVTIVAVKLVRATASLNHMTALSRELKILTHLGKHINVVNLLGACTKHVSYGQLAVIVEFCRYGNLRDYLLRSREDFFDEVNVTSTGNGTASTISNTEPDNAIDDGVHIADDNTGAATQDATTPAMSVDNREPGTDSAELGQRSKYEGDFKDENLEPIGTKDLLCWAWQVSRGMKYLGSRRIVHGDLAARNILLADNNIVKICDFGMAKALYADDHYKKKDHDPLPVKWMAPESLRNRTFSVHSDIWSYGIVLWEFFSLGETPYRGIASETLCQTLTEGFRMAKPKYSPKNIYHAMLCCWNEKPLTRPSFKELEQRLADFLDERVKTYYFDLDAPYIQMNAEALANGERDYLTMSPSEVASNLNEPTPP